MIKKFNNCSKQMIRNKQLYNNYLKTKFKFKNKQNKNNPKFYKNSQIYKLHNNKEKI